MSIDNGNYKKFGGIMNYTKIKDIRTDHFYANNIISKNINIQQLLWDLSDNIIRNTFPGNIVVGGDISGVISSVGTNGSEVTFRSDLQLWQTFTDVSMIGIITNKNQNYNDISRCVGITSDMSGSEYVYDGGVEISGVLLVGTGHANRNGNDGNESNYAFIHGISNEVVGNGKHNYVEGGNNRILAGSEFSHCEGFGNTIIGDFNHCESSGNYIQGNYCFASGISNEIVVDHSRLEGNWCFVEGYDNVIQNRVGTNSLLCKAEGISNTIYDSVFSVIRGENNIIGRGKGNICEGLYNTISGDYYSYNMIEGSGNQISESITGYGGGSVSGSFVAGMGNYTDASFSTVLGTYNKNNNTLFCVGRRTAPSIDISNAIEIRHNESIDSDTIFLNTTCSIGDVSAGWFRSNAVYNKVVDGKIQVEGVVSVTNTNTGVITPESRYTHIYSNSSSSGVETNIDCGSILCSGDVNALPHFTNGVKDYNSGFLFGSSNNLANADKWTVDTIKTESSDSNGTLIDVPYQYNIPCNLVDVSGAGFRAGAKTTLVIETNLDKIFINDASVCDIITVRPVDAVGSGTDVYLPAPYYGIGTMYTVQFPPVPTSYIASGSGSWNTGINYNRVIFDINGGGFFSGDSQTTVNEGYAIHFIYTAVNDGILWRTKLFKN